MTKLENSYSHQNSFVLMFWIVLFMFLNHFSTHTLQIHFFHPTSFISSLTHSLNSFTSYTASCITNLDNSVHPFHPSSSTFSSSHTPYQSAFRMLCNTILSAFSTKKCTSPLILFQPITHLRFSPFYLNATQRWTFSPFIHSSSHCCSTSSRNEIIPLFSDSIRHSKSTDRSWAEMPRSQWIAVCIDSIKKMICTSPDGL